jgi:hypothetical protein
MIIVFYFWVWLRHKQLSALGFQRSAVSHQ